MILPSAYDRAAVDDVAAGNAHRARVGDAARRSTSAAPPGFGQIDGVQQVRKRRHHVHRVADDQRLSFVAAGNAG